MVTKNNKKKNISKILIVDDSKLNRAILEAILDDRYEIIEAENGLRAVEILRERCKEISLVLLDMVMPKMDGLEVLVMMNKCHWIEEIPVIMISAENSHAVVNKAYELGATDYISRPFDEVIVKRRVINTIMLYSKQKRLFSMVAEQMYETEKSSNLMVAILSHIVEFRNGESGMHVLHIGTMTEMLLKCLQEKTGKYDLDSNKISLIGKAAAFHDIGKISIPESILNKPGRLTSEEFDVIKKHSSVGAEMLSNLPTYQNEPLVNLAYDICKCHHERYDGKGYPDGLRGEEIPIAAQVVALADVYDALTSPRVYKEAYSHEKAMSMILNGECGAFNPLLLDCLVEIGDKLKEELTLNTLNRVSEKTMRNIVWKMLSKEDLSNSNRALSILEAEQEKFQFFARMTTDIQFEYSVDPPVLTISDWGANRLGVPRIIVDPMNNKEIWEVINGMQIYKMDVALRDTTPENPVVERYIDIKIDGKTKSYRTVCRSLWTHGLEPEYKGWIGKVFDI